MDYGVLPMSLRYSKYAFKLALDGFIIYEEETFSEAVEIPLYGNMDTVSPDKISIQFIMGCQQHRAQKADDINVILNILDEKETHVKIRLNICEVINVGSSVINTTLRADSFSVYLKYLLQFLVHSKYICVSNYHLVIPLVLLNIISIKTFHLSLKLLGLVRHSHS